MLKHLLKISMKKTTIKIINKFEHLNLQMTELQMKVSKKVKVDLYKALCRDIDFLCLHGITGYKVEIMVEENMNDKMLKMFNM